MDLHRLDSDAVRSIQRLGARGYDSYLVGGCVRDLLLDRDPKDFDIATEARPQQVKRAFPRNCRIIGRRFKLAHLHFDGNQKILEVATFRSTPVPTNAENGEGETDEFDSEAEANLAEQDSVVEDATDEDVGDEDVGDRDVSDEDVGDEDAGDGDISGEDASDGDDEEADAGNATGDYDSDDQAESDEVPDPDEPDPSGDEVEPAPDEDLLIVRDNEFGTIEEDALRRDFTINALFHDPVRDVIIDYVDGIADVEAHVIRTIGDPVTRFREDPIRILRAVKFAGRLSFTLDPATGAAMRETAPDLVRAAPPRILEEILRLLRGGHALPSFQLLRDIGGIEPLLPTVHEYLESSDPVERRSFWCLLETLDNHIHNGAKPSNAVLLGCLFLRPLLTRFAASSGSSPATVAEELVSPLAQDLRLPRRDTGALKRICSVHPRFTASGKRRFRLASFLQDPHLHEAMELFELSCYAGCQDFDHLERWRELIAESPGVEEDPRDEPRVKKSGRSRRTRDSRDKGSRDRGSRDRDSREEEARDGETRDRDSRASKSPSKRTRSKRSEDKKKSQKKPAKQSQKQDEVLTIEPEAIDVSAFDRELGHREVPRFDTIVEKAGGASKTKRRVKIRDDDTYKPPPPPGGSDAPPAAPPPSTDDVFGDW